MWKRRQRGDKTDSEYMRAKGRETWIWATGIQEIGDKTRGMIDEEWEEIEYMEWTRDTKMEDKR